MWILHWPLMPANWTLLLTPWPITWWVQRCTTSQSTPWLWSVPGKLAKLWNFFSSSFHLPSFLCVKPSIWGGFKKRSHLSGRGSLRKSFLLIFWCTVFSFSCIVFQINLYFFRGFKWAYLFNHKCNLVIYKTERLMDM